ncbi:MAG: MBL fold metallo-hydrolase [Lachnospiraceae bacterium]|nr:MBL fold metallo-hydrolase [Lachnospiraceae bacterium]
MQFTVLGARGSIPISRPEFRNYGCATSCYHVEACGEHLFLDAGNGLVHAPLCTNKHAHILLTHPHLDHLVGLPFFPGMMDPQMLIEIYGSTRDGQTVRDYVDRLYSPPYWPCRVDAYPSEVRFHELEEELWIGDIRVIKAASCHPGGSDLLRVEAEGKSIVYATDFEPSDGAGERLTEFSKDADLLLYDGQYTEVEFEARKGFGHSTPMLALKTMQGSGAKRVMVVHHDPRHEDEFLARWEGELQQLDPRICFAREGMKLNL